VEKSFDVTEGGLVVSPNENNQGRRVPQAREHDTAGGNQHRHRLAQTQHHHRFLSRQVPEVVLPPHAHIETFRA
jgi:hypothetical protein